MLTWLITVALALAGFSIFVRRHSWRWRWDRVVTLSVACQAAGFVLCAPWQSHYLGRWVHHYRDLVGHLLFLMALVALIYAVLWRLVPEDQLDRIMRRFEVPAAVTASVMLVTLTLSASGGHHYCQPDFFMEKLDGWLAIYWAAYGTCLLYLLACLIQLLLVLSRVDPQSRLSANCYIAAALIGMGTIASVFARLAGAHVNDMCMWLPLCVSSSVAITGSAISWIKTYHSSRR